MNGKKETLYQILWSTLNWLLCRVRNRVIVSDFFVDIHPVYAPFVEEAGFVRLFDFWFLYLCKIIKWL